MTGADVPGTGPPGAAGLAAVLRSAGERALRFR